MKHSNLTLSQVKKLALEINKKIGPKFRIFGLVGPLGAGKTAFTKALAQTMGIKQAKSPTFMVMHCYQGRKNPLYHIDLYRLDDTKSLTALGLDEVLSDTNNVVVIEWVNKFPKLQKQCHAIITFAFAKENTRNVTIETL